MNGKLFVLLIVLVVGVCLIEASSALECPSSSTKVLNCTPKCTHDSDCSQKGGKCCSNICNGRSCAEPNLLTNSGGSSGGGSSSIFGSKNSGGSGTYCGNIKCGNFEKCETDRSTKRPKCVRA